MSTVIENLEREQLRRVPKFQPGDRVRVHFQVVEGTRRRTQVFEGVVLKRQGHGARETFTVRKQSFGVGVERTFPLHSPKIERIEVAARGDVRRAKLYYLRGRVGKRARVREQRGTGRRGDRGGRAAPRAQRGGRRRGHLGRRRARVHRRGASRGAAGRGGGAEAEGEGSGARRGRGRAGRSRGRGRAAPEAEGRGRAGGGACRRAAEDDEAAGDEQSG